VEAAHELLLLRSLKLTRVDFEGLDLCLVLFFAHFGLLECFGESVIICKHHLALAVLFVELLLYPRDALVDAPVEYRFAIGLPSLFGAVIVARRGCRVVLVALNCYAGTSEERLRCGSGRGLD